ncbi:MAG: proline--tRNA ligase [Pseudomonadota bacterium]
MQYSKLFLPTLRESPAEAEVISHKLMLRSGMIRKLTSGIYTYLPLGLRAIKKVERIIREEMEKAGAQEVLMPMVQPAELWKESHRWELYGKELLRFRDRHGRDYCMGPTHEEVITDLIRKEVRSYRDLPLNLYQIQHKFRDEIRPRFGLMRGREFLMKDGYSFDIDEESASNTYMQMFDAYNRIFSRCGLAFKAVEADTGNIGGNFSHEFMVLAKTGEDAIVSCNECSYAANMEKAEVITSFNTHIDEPRYMPIEKKATPNIRTVEEVTAFLSIPHQLLVKTMIFKTTSGPIAVLVRGDHEVNPAKVKNILKVDSVDLADEETIERLTGATIGFSGPVGLSIPIVADNAVKSMRNMVTGANVKDTHITGVNIGRDFTVAQFEDLRFAVSSDTCPRCGKPIEIKRGIEVGHIFKLGTKYSKALSATFLDKTGQEQAAVMGCYGIGVGRTVAAAIEQNHDQHGIIFPMPIAPFHATILPLQMQSSEVVSTAQRLYQELSRRGVETMIDDRDERPGVKFNDSDLIGIPIRIAIGEKSLKQGKVELKLRAEKNTTLLSIEEALETVENIVKAQIKNDTHK